MEKSTFEEEITPEELISRLGWVADRLELAIRRLLDERKRRR